MKKYIEKKEIKTTRNLFHFWANQLLNPNLSYKKGDYSVEKGKYLYFKNRLIAYWNEEYKTFFIDGDFNNMGSFGNGSSYYHILCSVPKNKKSCIYLFTEQEINNQFYFLERYKKYFIRNNNSDFCKISYLKELANNNKTKSTHLSNADVKFEHIVIPKKLFSKYKNDIINIKLENLKFSYEKYIGWSKINYLPAIVINHTIKEILSKKFVNSFFTKEELKMIEIKKWREDILKRRTYYNSYHYILSLKDTIEAYKNPELKQKYEDDYELYKVNEELSKIEKEKKEAIKLEKTIIEKIESFRNNKGITYISSFLKYIKLEENRVKVSNNVQILLSDAKKLYKMFKQYVEENKDFSKYSRKLSIGHFTFLGFQKEDVRELNEDDTAFIDYEELPTVLVGCTRISWIEAQKFVKHNNLEW